MVRAILAGTKTQTRRIVKAASLVEFDDGGVIYVHSPRCPSYCDYACAGRTGWRPHGEPGDRLWVREAFSACRHGEKHPKCVDYRADSPGAEYKWKPSIYMPRALSRIDLEIADV